MDNSQFEQKKKHILEQIRNQILAGGQPAQKCFHVFTAEAGLGKTRTCEEALVELWRKTPEVKSLFVKPFRDKDEEFPSFKRINELAGFQIAIPVDAEVLIKIRSIRDETAREIEYDKLRKVPILIITHAQYIRMCKLPDDAARTKLYIEGRTNLIIDEELKMLEPYDVSFRSIDKAREYLELHPHLYIRENGKTYYALDMFNQIASELEKLMVHVPRGGLFVPRTIIPEYPQCSISNVRSVIFNSFNREIETSKVPSNKDRIKALKDYVRSIFILWHKTFESDGNYGESHGYYYTWKDTVLVSPGKMSAYDAKFRYILLKNNILLDASAKFNYVYKLQPSLFKVIDQERVVDHGASTIHVCYKNTTKTAKDRNPDFYKDIIGYIKSDYKDGDKVLIVCKNDELNHIKVDIANSIPEATIDYANFQNLRGKNNWKDFNKCYIIHTPNISYAYYYFMYEMFISFGDKGYIPPFQSFIPWKTGKNLCFKDEDMEMVRKTYIAANIYQAIMRVNRDQEHPAQIYIINSDRKVINIVKEQMLNVQFHEFTLGTPKERKKYDSSKRVRSSQIGRFIDFLLGDNFGEHSKEYIREKIGCKGKKSFNEKVVQQALNTLEGNSHIRYAYGNNSVVGLNDREIKLEHKKIIISKLESHP